jgi:hypothetical protein
MKLYNAVRILVGFLAGRLADVKNIPPYNSSTARTNLEDARIDAQASNTI